MSDNGKVIRKGIICGKDDYEDIFTFTYEYLTNTYKNSEGDHLLARAIGKRLVEDSFFKKKYFARNSQKVLSNVRLNEELI
tara:strand:+ start:710 stop:952 length:243 start_codon:yes stop_codon:yes gene_type:complete